MNAADVVIGAVVLAAGQSSRMGKPKLTLSWRGTTIIGQVISTLREAKVEHITVVTGGAMDAVENALKGLDVKTVYNEAFTTGEMLSSLQVGLKHLPAFVDAMLVVLGDQPQMQVRTVEQVMARYKETRSRLVAPSFQMQRGHPWLVDRQLWPKIALLQSPYTLRNFIHNHETELDYVVVDTPSVLQDLDTPQDYERQQPG